MKAITNFIFYKIIYIHPIIYVAIGIIIAILYMTITAISQTSVYAVY